MNMQNKCLENLQKKNNLIVYTPKSLKNWNQEI
jgi:hypothetical protein